MFGVFYHCSWNNAQWISFRRVLLLRSVSCPFYILKVEKKTMHIYLYVTIHYTQKHLLLKCLDKRCWGSWSSKMPCLSHREVTHLLLFFILQMSHICCSDVFTIFLFIVLVLLPYVDIAVMEAKAFSCLKNLSCLFQVRESFLCYCNWILHVTMKWISLFTVESNYSYKIKTLKKPPYVKVEVDVWPSSDLIFFPSVMPSGGVVSRAFSLGNWGLGGAAVLCQIVFTSLMLNWLSMMFFETLCVPVWCGFLVLFLVPFCAACVGNHPLPCGEPLATPAH